MPPPEQAGDLNRSSAPYLAVSLGISDRAASREINFGWQVHERLPMLGRQLGSGMREFKDSITKRHDDDDDERPPAIASASGAVEPEPVTGEVVGERREP